MLTHVCLQSKKSSQSEFDFLTSTTNFRCFVMSPDRSSPQCPPPLHLKSVVDLHFHLEFHLEKAVPPFPLRTEKDTRALPPGKGWRFPVHLEFPLEKASHAIPVESFSSTAPAGTSVYQLLAEDADEDSIVRYALESGPSCLRRVAYLRVCGVVVGGGRSRSATSTARLWF